MGNTHAQFHNTVNRKKKNALTTRSAENKKKCVSQRSLDLVSTDCETKTVSYMGSTKSPSQDKTFPIDMNFLMVNNLKMSDKQLCTMKIHVNMT